VKVFGTLCGMFFLGLLGLAMWWFYWNDHSKQQVQSVKSQIAVLEAFWNKRSAVEEGRLIIGYKDISAVGFPFTMSIRLFRPYIRDKRGNHEFTLAASYLDFVPLDEKGNHYELEYPSEGQAQINADGNKLNYYLSLSQTPPLFARKVAVGKRFPVAVNQYGLQLPQKLTFTADLDGKLQRYPMQLRSTDEPLYRPLFTNMRERLGALRGLLRRGGYRLDRL